VGKTSGVKKNKKKKKKRNKTFCACVEKEEALWSAKCRKLLHTDV